MKARRTSRPETVRRRVPPPPKETDLLAAPEEGTFRRRQVRFAFEGRRFTKMSGRSLRRGSSPHGDVRPMGRAGRSPGALGDKAAPRGSPADGEDSALSSTGTGTSRRGEPAPHEQDRHLPKRKSALPPQDPRLSETEGARPAQERRLPSPSGGVPGRAVPGTTQGPGRDECQGTRPRRLKKP